MGGRPPSSIRMELGADERMSWPVSTGWTWVDDDTEVGRKGGGLEGSERKEGRWREGRAVEKVTGR